jgi:hypothetical protein
MSTEQATRNEAAERLRMALDLADTLDHAIKSRQSGHIVDGHATEYRRFRLGMSVADLDEALATERRNVVEQVRDAVRSRLNSPPSNPRTWPSVIAAILDSIATGTEEEK